MLATAEAEPSPNGAATAAAPASDPAPRAEPPTAEPEEDASLPVGELVASVVAGRLSDPKALFAGAGIFAMICLVIGYLVGRAR